MRRVTIAATLAVAALSMSSADVSATPPTPADGQTWSSNQRVTYRWKEGSEPPSWMKAAINAAADDSNDSRDAKTAVLDQSDGGDSWIAYTGDITTNWAVGYTVRYIPSFFTMRLRPQGYPLDWGTMRWCQFYDSPPSGCYDAEMIALHEFGHAQTLDHPDDADVTDWTDTVMHWAPKTKSKAGWNQHEFGPCDVARLQIRYEPLAPSTKISTCLDLATTLTLSVNDTQVSSGSSVTFTARLKIADGVMWPLLQSEPLASRQITLQKRAPGGSWANVTGMGSGDDNGRYLKTMTLSDTFDYRAVFSGPGNEGLDGSTSPILTVNVSSGGGGGGDYSCVRGVQDFYQC
jgi:hypothetical protein